MTVLFVPPPPTETKMFDDEGHLSRPWLTWFQQITQQLAQPDVDQDSSGLLTQRVRRITTDFEELKGADSFMAVDHTVQGPVRLLLPKAADAWTPRTNVGQLLTIADTGANAGTNPILVRCQCTDSIVGIARGQRQVAMETNGEVMRLQAIDLVTWKVL